MSKTIEQRWRVVGVEREEVAIALLGQFRQETVGVIAAWSVTSQQVRERYLAQADALLPLIEKAVLKARRKEVGMAWRMWEGHLGLAQGSALETYFNGRIRKLEAGNDSQQTD